MIDPILYRAAIEKMMRIITSLQLGPTTRILSPDSTRVLFIHINNHRTLMGFSLVLLKNMSKRILKKIIHHRLREL